MEKYFKKVSKFSSSTDDTSKEKVSTSSLHLERIIDVAQENDVEFILSNLPTDPGLRPRILDYHPNIQDQVRRAYLYKGPCQPRNYDFPTRKFGKYERRFVTSWYDDHVNWLEYSISKDALYCLYCYLFKPENGDQGGGETFVGDGFRNWKKKERLMMHVGGPKSDHNYAMLKCDALLRQNQHIQTFFDKHSNQDRYAYRIRLNAIVDCVRFLLQQGLAFRGHDESNNSTNRGNFLELLKFLASHNEDVKAVTFHNAPQNDLLTSPNIQKEIVHVASMETTNVILQDMGEALFSILIDESRDVSTKEQLAIVLRYVNKSGNVVECFIGIEHVTSTTAVSLKKAVDNLFSKHGLNISRLRGQGYDGASNMQGELNGLKTLILKENACAYYVHCFAHQLQLALMAVAKNNVEVQSFFNIIANVVNVVGGSCKRRDVLREKQALAIVKALCNDEISSGQGQNQETNLKRFGDTRWGSHYGTLLSIITMFQSIIDVLEMIVEDGATREQRCEASNLLDSMQSFEFIFGLYLMKNILSLTNELSLALQRKDQDIVNAMKLVRLCKDSLQMMRENGWDYLFSQVVSFCDTYNIDVPNMDGIFITRGRSRRKAQKTTNLHHYRVELFYVVLDAQLQELNNRFNETNTELLLCLASLSPCDSFSSFNKQNLVRLAQFYPTDFSSIELIVLEGQLDTYIMDMRSSIEFSKLNGIGELAAMLVQTKKDKVYPLLYLLLTLALTLPVATATVERAFSAMNIVKTRLRNRMGDQWMNDNLVTYIEKNVFMSIDNETIMQGFQNMKSRRGQL